MVDRNAREHFRFDMPKVRKMNVGNMLGEGRQRYCRNGKPFRQRKDVNWSVMQEPKLVSKLQR